MKSRSGSRHIHFITRFRLFFPVGELNTWHIFCKFVFTEHKEVTMNRLAILAALLIGPLVQAVTIHVPADQPTIQAGIDVAQPGDTVQVMSGCYTGPGNRDISFQGKNIRVVSEWGYTSCTIDCQGSIDDPHRGFIFTSGETSQATLEGFTIRNGWIDGRGGGILCDYASSPGIVNCRIILNTATYGAGVACLRNAAPQIVDCYIEQNFASRDGGGFNFSQSGASVTCCIIRNNTAELGAGASMTYDSNPTIFSSFFISNTATLYGGALFFDSWASGQIRNCEFQLNVADHLGGALFCNYGATPIIGGSPSDGNSFSDNQAGGGADLASMVFDPQEPFNAQYNGFSGLHDSDYYVSPPDAFDRTGCTSQTDAITQDVYVSCTGNDLNSGLSWESSFLTLRHALERILGSPDLPVVIHIGPGVFSAMTTGESFPLPIVNHVTLAGSGIESTIIDAGDIQRIFYGHIDHSAVIQDLTIRGGRARAGGGIYLTRSDTSILRCRIENNTAMESGGGVYIENSSPAFTDCILSSNSAYESGGGIQNDGEANPSFLRCSFIGNGAETGSGGGYSNRMFSLQTFDQCRFIDNAAGQNGGAIDLSAKCVLAVITRSVLSGNIAGSNGGAIFGGWDVSADIWGCLIDSNHASDSGGACYFSSSTTTGISSCTLAFNTADTTGSALFCHDSPAITVENSILWGGQPSPIGGDTQFVTVISSDVQGGWAGSGNIDQDPLFTNGPIDAFCLSQIASGQESNSPCFETGSASAVDVCHDISNEEICMDSMTTRTDRVCDNGMVDMGYHYPLNVSETPTPTRTAGPSPTATISATPSPTAPATSTPESTQSAVPSPTITPTASPTAPCGILGVELWMPSHFFHPGDSCSCIVRVCNPGPQAMEHVPLFVVLEAFGQYYFAPGFTAFDHYLFESLMPGITEQVVVPPFSFPENVGTVEGLFWYAGMTDAEFSFLVGAMDSWEFGWGDHP